MGTVGPTYISLTRLSARSGTTAWPWLLSATLLLVASGGWLVWRRRSKRK